MKKILKTALFSSAVIASVTVGLTTISCGTKTPDSHYKTQKELEVIFNKSNLTTPITKVITQRFVTKDVTKPVISDTSFKTSLIRDTESYNPEVNISGSFEYSPSPKNNITNIFSLIISYDEKNSIYQSSFININTIANNNNIDPILNGPMACSKWNNAVMLKINQSKIGDLNVSKVKLTKLISWNTIKNTKGDLITTGYYRGTLTYKNKTQIVSAEVVYNATKKTGQVIQAIIPLLVDQGNDFIFGSGTVLFRKLSSALKDLISKNWTSSFYRDLDWKSISLVAAHPDSVTSTKLIVSGNVKTLQKHGNGIPVASPFVANLSYDFRTLKYARDPNKNIKIIPNDKILLGHNQVVNVVKARLINKTDTLNSFQVQSFVAKTDTQPAYDNVVGWLTTQGNISKIFYMKVILKDKKPIAGDYNSVVTDNPFRDLSANGELYKQVLKLASTLPNFAKFTITSADKSKFTDPTEYPYWSNTKIYLNITLKNTTVVKYTAQATYEFDKKIFYIQYPTPVKS